MTKLKIRLKEILLNKTFFMILGIWAICAIIFGYYDLQISNMVVNEASPLTQFGQDYGELPGYGLIAVCILICFGCYYNTLKSRKIIGLIGIIAGLLVIGWGCYGRNMPIILIGCAILISICLFLFIAGQVSWRRFRILARIELYLAMIVPLLFVQTVKILSGRVRYNDLLPGQSNYTPWFVFHGLDFHNSSFPSGHTAMAWMLLPLMIFIWKNNYRKLTKIIGSILIIGWGVFVSLGRGIIGAHYASDVLFSTGMAVSITFLLYKIYYGKQ